MHCVSAQVLTYMHPFSLPWQDEETSRRWPPRIICLHKMYSGTILTSHRVIIPDYMAVTPSSIRLRKRHDAAPRALNFVADPAVGAPKSRLVELRREMSRATSYYSLQVAHSMTGKSDIG